MKERFTEVLYRNLWSVLHEIIEIENIEIIIIIRIVDVF